MTGEIKMIKEVTVRVPATTANCGSGFDCFGIALTYYNTFTFSILENPGFKVEVQGEGSDSFLPNSSNLAIDSFLQVFKKNNKPLPCGVGLKMQNNIPLARGMGSSSSAIVGGVLAGSILSGSNLSKQQLLSLANEIEGHPDNVAPAILGGITLSYMEDNDVFSHNILSPVPFKLVVVVPQLRLETKLARSVLPKEIKIKDAIFNMSRTALFVNSIQTGNLHYLKHALQDRIHQPYRSTLIPNMQKVFDSAILGGAFGAAISGAGSSLIAFCPIDSNTESIGKSMQQVFVDSGINACYHVLDVDNDGAIVI